MPEQIVTIHGGDTFASYDDYLAQLRETEIDLERMKTKDWKSTLSEKLGPAYGVLAPRMPNAQNAKYLEWKIWFEKLIPLLNENIILVGHSLGGIFITKYLSEETFPKKIRATFLLAAPYHAEAGESLADFVLPDSLEKFSHQAGEIFLYHSHDDPVVPFSHFELYRQALPHAHARIFTDRQHFNQEEFPELVEEIQKMPGG